MLGAAAFLAPACTNAPAAPASCVSSRECSVVNLVCDIASSRCVECLTAADCLGGSQICREHACVMVTPCTSSRMCPGQVCDVGAGFCVDCLTNADCTGGQLCTANVCVAAPTPCVSDRECSATVQVCDVGRGICVDCVRDADCPGGHCAGGTCHAGGADSGIDAGVDSGIDSGIDAATSIEDTGTSDDASGPSDAHVSIDAATPMDAGMSIDSGLGCIDDHASATCPTATPVGSGTVGSGGSVLGTVGSLSAAGAAAWYTIQFPSVGGTLPHVDFAMNDGMSFVFDVFSDCAGTSGQCAGGESGAGLTSWDFNDGCVPSVCHTSRTDAWPSQLWIRVRRLTVTAACTYYQLHVSDLMSTCEASTVAHCGTSCRDCTHDVANANVPTCTAGGSCDYVTCITGATDCDGNRANGCELWSTNACGPTCTNCDSTLPNTTSTSCSAGACQFTACTTGYGNCDGLMENGCERMTAATSAECCGVACTSPATCTNIGTGDFACR